MSKVWFTADTHFGHARAIDYCQRPFATAEEMDAAMIEAWNARVARNDIVYHLGDFAISRDPRTVRRIFQQLAGQKFLVPGNHDYKATLDLPWAKKDHLQFKTIGDQQIVMCHYAMLDWPASHHGAIQIYGHRHGSRASTHNQCDVGVDCWAFAPVSLDDIRRRLAETPAPEGEPEPAGLTVP